MRPGGPGTDHPNDCLCGICHCGCGKKTRIASQSCAQWGIRQGEPRRFVRGHSSSPRSHNWRGGKHRAQGYIRVYAPNHLLADTRGYVAEHILMAIATVGRLPESAEVHHVNGDKSDNRRGNIVICQDHGYHMLLYRRLRAKRACGNPSYRRCVQCKEWKDVAELRITRIRDTAYKCKARCPYRRVSDLQVHGTPSERQEGP